MNFPNLINADTRSVINYLHVNDVSDLEGAYNLDLKTGVITPTGLKRIPIYDSGNFVQLNEFLDTAISIPGAYKYVRKYGPLFTNCDNNFLIPTISEINAHQIVSLRNQFKSIKVEVEKLTRDSLIAKIQQKHEVTDQFLSLNLHTKLWLQDISNKKSNSQKVMSSDLFWNQYHFKNGLFSKIVQRTSLAEWLREQLAEMLVDTGYCNNPSCLNTWSKSESPDTRHYCNLDAKKKPKSGRCGKIVNSEKAKYLDKQKSLETIEG